MHKLCTCAHVRQVQQLAGHDSKMVNRAKLYMHLWLIYKLGLITLKFLSFFPVIIVMRSGSAGEPIKDRLNRGTIRHANHSRWRPVKGGGRRKHDDRNITADSTNWQESIKEKQFLSPKQSRRACKVKRHKLKGVTLPCMKQVWHCDKLFYMS